MEKIRAEGVSVKILMELSREEMVKELSLSEVQADALVATMKEEEERLTSVRTWSEEEVVEWLGSLGKEFAAYEDSFLFHNVNGDLLLDLTAEDLVDDLGVDKLGHRMQILDEIAYLKKICYKSARSSKGLARNQMNLPSFDEIENLKRQKAIRLQSNLDVLKHKVNQMRDAEAKAKLLARQAEAEAGKIQTQLRRLKTEPKEQGKNDKLNKRGVPGQCTFKPKLNPTSLEIVERTFGDSDIHRRFESQKATKEKKLKELQKMLSADDKTEAELREKYMKYFQEKLEWDTSSGVQESKVDSFLSNPAAYNVELTDKQIRHIRRLKGAPQYVAIYHACLISDFLQRNWLKAANEAKAKSENKQAATLKQPNKLDKYFIERFKWKEVNNGRLDDLLDNSKAYELELSEQQLAHFRNLEVSKKKHAIFQALQTQSFLMRNAADVRRREQAQLKAFEVPRPYSAVSGRGGRNVVRSFLERYHQDMETRQERKKALVDKVKKEDPNFKECTFRPNLHARSESPELAENFAEEQTA
ncbi:hypothetical protein GUITHDRAFT_105768 [Guillardia theta CCMP2712]|uniref:SAM domain-containing protein n=1 Tax=Guillardia theta (strain CCMP2712) TaxID=905079 RepID=L1JKD6_GUITC|nr:hypothetical protein GUITHDRAFT_105768 [Guillardia theta CCMP2712]EKX48624.1 hypothetical protein GUITHDRAFT_105768 [Guillardia theta CCMP2712]|eukprot:XP_005835604.1 hypothetical protein GUITHDRAFT_105768 [Guillardia theta CCMP2712]